MESIPRFFRIGLGEQQADVGPQGSLKFVNDIHGTHLQNQGRDNVPVGGGSMMAGLSFNI